MLASVVQVLLDCVLVADDFVIDDVSVHVIDREDDARWLLVHVITSVEGATATRQERLKRVKIRLTRAVIIVVKIVKVDVIVVMAMIIAVSIGANLNRVYHISSVVVDNVDELADIVALVI